MGKKRDDIVRVVVGVEGGVVQGVSATHPGVEVLVLDYDIDGADDGTYASVPQVGGEPSDAFLIHHDTDEDPDWVNAVWKVAEKFWRQP